MGGATKWMDDEVKLFASIMRDKSIDEGVDVTDNIWKSMDKNYQDAYQKLKEIKADWKWEPPQLKVKWKNILSDYSKTKKLNATTGERRRVMACMDILDQFPAQSPLALEMKANTPSNPSSVLDFEPKKRQSEGTTQKGLDSVEQAILAAVRPKATNHKESKLTYKLELEKTKVDLFKSFNGRNVEETKQMLYLYKKFKFEDTDDE